MLAALTLHEEHVVRGQEVAGLGTSPWIADTLQGRLQRFHRAQGRYDFGAALFLARAPDSGTLLEFRSQLQQGVHVRTSGRVRCILVELGRRLHAVGQFADPHDISYLSVEEIPGLVDGTAVSVALSGRWPASWWIAVTTPKLMASRCPNPPGVKSSRPADASAMVGLYSPPCPFSIPGAPWPNSKHFVR